MKTHCLCLLLFFYFLGQKAYGTDRPYTYEITVNDSNTEKKSVLDVRQKWIIGGLITQQAASLYLEYKWWWKDDYHPFVMRSDGGFGNYSLGLDKVGHFYTSYMYSNLLYELMKWGNFNEKTSEWVSVALPFAWALSIEIGDGFSSFEFSPQDLLANSIGIGYAVLQRKIPYLQHFNCKFSYFPHAYYLNNNFKGWSLTSDYDGHIYWVTADIHGILPKTAKKYWPKYINMGLGYGINNFAAVIHYWEPNTVVQREFMLGLDINLNRLPIKNKSLKTFVKMADYIHLPAPGYKNTNQENWKFNGLLLN
jgi:hypothetical protein